MSEVYDLRGLQYDSYEDVDVRIPDRDPTWGESMTAAVALQPFWQTVMQATDPILPPDEPDYNPFIDENLAGYEQYYSDFLGSSSTAESDRIKARIDDNLEMRRKSEELGMLSFLLTEFANPVNYVPLPAIAAGRGAMTVGRSIARGGALFGGAIALEETVRQQVDPTATLDESLLNVGYATMFGGLFGGIAGGVAARGFKNADIARVTDEFLAETAVQGPPTRDGVRPAYDAEMPAMFSGGGGTFTARPTADGQVGIASALGLEKVVTNLLPTLWSKLQGTGIKSVADFADRTLGDYGLKLKANESGIATPESVTVTASRWRGMAGDLTRELEQIWTKYKSGGGEGGVRVGDMSPSVIASRTQQLVGRMGGPAPVGPRMNDREFYDAVFRAHKRNGIETDDPFVKEGVAAVRKYFDKARENGIGTGLLRTKEGWVRKVDVQIKRAQELIAREQELLAKGSLSNNEKLHLLKVKQAQARVLENLQSNLLRTLDVDGELDEYVSAWQSRQKEFYARLFDTGRDIVARGARRKSATEEAFLLVERQIEEDRKLVAYFNQLEETIGLTDKQRKYRDDLQAALDEYDAAKDTAAKSGETPTIYTKKELAYLERLQDMLSGKRIFDDADFHPKNDPFYLPRVWALDKIEGREDELKAILVAWFRENPLGDMSQEALERRAERAIDKIMKRATLEEYQLFSESSAGASFLNARGLDIPNELVADFVETDVTKLANMYGQRFGVMNEMQRAFGDVSALDSIDDVIMQSALEIDASDLAKGLEQLDELEGQLARARDFQTGAIFGTDEASMTARRRVSYIKGYGITISMGGAVLSSLTELTRPMMVYGFTRTIGAGLEALTNKQAFRELRNEMRTWTAQGSDATLTGSTVSRFNNVDGPAGGSTSGLGKVARAHTDFAYGPYFKLNLLTPFTDMVKGWSNYLGAKFLYEDIMKASDDPAVAQRLASYGLTPDDIKAIQMERVAEVDHGSFKMNLDQWSDDGAARRFAAAVGGMTRRTIVTASNADLPDIVKGFIGDKEAPWLTLPFQFMSWGFGAVNKILLSGLQGRDQSLMAGAVSLVGWGYIIEALKVPEYIWENMSAEERMVRAIDRSGLFGVFSDIPTMVETATAGEISARSAIGLDPFVRNPDYIDAIGEALGPGLGTIASGVGLLIDEGAETKDYTSAMRRAIPLNNILYWKELFRDFERGVAEKIDDSGEEELMVN